MIHTEYRGKNATFLSYLMSVPDDTIRYLDDWKHEKYFLKRDFVRLNKSKCCFRELNSKFY